MEKNESDKNEEKCYKWLLTADLKNVNKNEEGYKIGSLYMPEKIYNLWNKLDGKTKSSILLEVNKEREDVEIKSRKIFLDTKKKKDDKIQICSLVEKDRIIEEIYVNKKALFIVYDAINGIRTESELSPYIPKVDDLLEKGTVLLPEGIMDYGTAEELKDEIQEFIHKYVDIPEELEELCTYYILLTWLYDKLNTIPYLRPIGDTGTGKSRLNKVIGGLCYHSTSIAGAVTPAPIYRMIEQWKPTLIIDEGDVKQSNEKNEFITILNCGFERNNPVIRCNKENPNKLESHEVFCPKLIATRYRFEDSALESRCITIEMKNTGRDDIPILLPKKFYEKIKELQKKLLKFRLDTYFLIDGDVSERLQKELHRDIDKRLLQATGPLLCLTGIPGFDEVYKNFIEGYNVKLIEERQNSKTGMIVNAAFDLIKIELKMDFIEKGKFRKKDIEEFTEDEMRLLVKEIMEEREELLKKLQNIKLTSGDVVTYIKETLKDDVGTRTVGRELKAVGIESKSKWDSVDKRTKRILNFDEVLLRNLEIKYRLPDERFITKHYINYENYVLYMGAMGIPDFLKKEKDSSESDSLMLPRKACNKRNERNEKQKPPEEENPPVPKEEKVNQLDLSLMSEKSSPPDTSAEKVTHVKPVTTEKLDTLSSHDEKLLLLLEILFDHREGLSQDKIVSLTKLSRGFIRRAISELLSKKVVSMEGKKIYLTESGKLKVLKSVAGIVEYSENEKLTVTS